MVSALGGEPIPRPGLLPRTICWQTLEFLGPQSPTLWAQRCLCGVKEGGREQAVLASGKMSGESGLLTCPSLPSSLPLPRSLCVLPHSFHYQLSGLKPHTSNCHSSLLPAQFPPPPLPRCQSPIQRVFEFKAFHFDKKKKKKSDRRAKK